MADVSRVLKAFLNSYAEMKPDELRVQLIDLRDMVGELEEENRKLRTSNEKLRVALNRRKNMEYHDGGYYILRNEEEIGPICPECYQRKGLIYLLESNSKGASCSVCNTYYSGARASIKGYKQKLL